MKTISIVYHYFAHYREPVLRKFCHVKSNEYQLELISGTSSNLPDLQTIPEHVLASISLRRIVLKNLWFGPLLWQSGLIRALLMSSSKDIVFLGQINFISTWIGVLICKIFGKNVYFWTHGVYGNERFFKRWIRFIFYNQANGVFLYGNYAKNLLIQQGFSSKNLHVIYNSLDYELQLKLRISLKDNLIKDSDKKKSPYIIFVGRLTAVKRLDVLLKAIYLIKQTFNKEIRCLLVGDGPNRNKLTELATELKINYLIDFYGPCHNESVLSDLIYNADICVSPGNVGLTAMHALVYGTPVITHASKEWQMPEFEAIIPGLTGDFFERNNSDDLADKIYNWIGKDLSERRKIRNDCFKIIDDFYNPTYQINTILDVIDQQ